MNNIDILFPLIAGLFAILSGDKLVKPTDPSFEKKKLLIKRCGYVLVAVAALYFVIKMFG